MSQINQWLTSLKSIVARNFMLLGSSYLAMGVQVVIFFFLTPFFLKSLGADQYGVWLLFGNLVTYFSLSNLGLNNTFLARLPHVKNNYGQTNALISTIFYSLLVLSGFMLAVALVVVWWLPDLFALPSDLHRAARYSFAFIVIGFILNMFYTFFDSVLYIGNNIVLKNSIEILRIVVLNLFLFLGVFVFGGLVAMSITQVVVFSIFLLIVYAYSTKALHFQINPDSFDKKLLVKLINPSIHYFLITIASQVVFYSDTILVSALAGIPYVAMYSIIWKLVDLFSRMIFKFADVKLPRIAELWVNGKMLELRRFHNRVFGLTLVSASVVCIGIMVFGKALLEIWLGDEYQINVSVLRILSMTMVVNCCIHVTAVFVLAMERHSKVAYMSFAEAILNIFLSIYFFKLIGLPGIPLGTLISSLLTTAWFLLFTFYRLTEVPESSRHYNLMK